MTQEQKRIELAEAAGWKRKGKNKIWINPNPGGGFDYLSDLPDYFNNLNAVHELEKVLTPKQHSLFREELSKIVKFDGLSMRGAREYISSSAAQRAEALGKTLNLW